ncbi:chitin deacetylase [Polyrhizophydium stewartii]|uniref:Chitin deacetylase n=1 Tax=Polyrhizophydium stewartii TaxID=2732419 RepID=A0ABR4NBI8_9FUNG
MHAVATPYSAQPPPQDFASIYSSPRLVVDGYDFSEYPLADQPPPINATWNAKYDIASINLPNVPVKNPLNSVEEPPCPLTSATCDWTCFNCTRPTDDVACKDHNTWALSYDDGPSEYTVPILEALNKIGAKATFCILGSRALAHPAILRRVYDAGHQICVHTWSHRFLTTQTNEQIVAEFEWTLRIIQQMNLVPLLWNRDTFDWKLASANSGFDAKWVTGNFTNWIATAGSTSTGFMSLEHDLYPQSAGQALPALDLVSKAGYKLQTASQCIGTNPYLSVVSVPIPVVAPVGGPANTSPIAALPTGLRQQGVLAESAASRLPVLSVLASCALALFMSLAL